MNALRLSQTQSKWVWYLPVLKSLLKMTKKDTLSWLVLYQPCGGVKNKSCIMKHLVYKSCLYLVGSRSISPSERANSLTTFRASSAAVEKPAWLLTSTSVLPCMMKPWTSSSSQQWLRRSAMLAFLLSDFFTTHLSYWNFLLDKPASQEKSLGK